MDRGGLVILRWEERSRQGIRRSSPPVVSCTYGKAIAEEDAEHKSLLEQPPGFP